MLAMVVTIITTVTYVLQIDYSCSGPISVLNLLVPLFFLLIFTSFGVAATKRNPMLLWTPAVFFLAYTAVFKDLGPLVHVFGNEATLSAIARRVFSLTDHELPGELPGTHLLNLIGTLAILKGIFICSNNLPHQAVADKFHCSSRPNL